MNTRQQQSKGIRKLSAALTGVAAAALLVAACLSAAAPAASASDK